MKFNSFRAGAMALALVGTVSLGGCASCPSCNIGQWIDTQINATTSWAASPQTTQAVANLKAGAQALDCGIASASALASTLEQELKVKQAVIGADGKVYAVSATICGAIGGTSTPAPAVVP